MLGQIEDGRVAVCSILGEKRVVELLIMVWNSGGALKTIWTFCMERNYYLTCCLNIDNESA